MERSANEYPQSGLPSPYPSSYGDNHSEGSTADHHPSGPQYPVKQEPNYQNATTPNSEYSAYPQSARPGSYQEHLHRPYHQASSSASAGMAQQQPNSPSLPQQDGRNHHQAHAVKSDNDVPIDPSIAPPNAGYAYPPQQHAPYAPNPDIGHGGYSHPSGAMYAPQRPEWGTYQPAPSNIGHPVYAHSPASAPPQQRPSQVS